MTTIDDEIIFFFILRILVGLIFIYHGFSKVNDMQSWIKTMSSKEITSFIAIFSGWLEIIVGIFLFLGFLTRISAFFAASFMIVAIYLVHIKDPILSYIYQIALFVVSLILIFTEPSILSLDSIISIK